MGQFEVLKKIQEIELDALKEFNKICKENNLMFFLRGGSVMGAVKYQGFIPWDDDLDIFMPRPDYERLAELWLYTVINDIPIVGQREIKSIMMRVHQFAMKKRLSSIAIV